MTSAALCKVPLHPHSLLLALFPMVEPKTSLRARGEAAPAQTRVGQSPPSARQGSVLPKPSDLHTSQPPQQHWTCPELDSEALGSLAPASLAPACAHCLHSEPHQKENFPKGSQHKLLSAPAHAPTNLSDVWDAEGINHRVCGTLCKPSSSTQFTPCARMILPCLKLCQLCQDLWKF